MSLHLPFFLPSKIKYNNKKKTPTIRIWKKSLLLRLAIYITLQRITSKHLCFYSIRFYARTILRPWSVPVMKESVARIMFLTWVFLSYYSRLYTWAHWSLVYIYDAEQCSWITQGPSQRLLLLESEFSYTNHILTLYTIFHLAWKVKKWLIIIASRE